MLLLTVNPQCSLADIPCFISARLWIVANKNFRPDPPEAYGRADTTNRPLLGPERSQRSAIPSWAIKVKCPRSHKSMTNTLLMYLFETTASALDSASGFLRSSEALNPSAKHAHFCQSNRGARLARVGSGAEAVVSKRPFGLCVL